jgi:hypothetical protein
MDELLGKFYENAADLPMEVIQERFDSISDEVP